MKFDERKVLINSLESGALNARELIKACKIFSDTVFDTILEKLDEKEIKKLLLDFLKAEQNP